MPATDSRQESVLDFWLGPPPHVSRAEWFRKDAAFDSQVRERFGTTIAQALAGGFGEWCRTPRGSVARVIVLDQFTRNVFRDSAAAFSGDARALATAQAALDEGFDRAQGSSAPLGTFERYFLYMPLEHSEDMAMQDRSLQLFTALAEDDAAATSALDYAQRHRTIIERFGRFPHRNALLGRTSTAAEVAFLATPGSSF